MIENLAPSIATGLLASILGIGPAIAPPSWPASVVGTWTAQVADKTLAITISDQAARGACRVIVGTVAADSAAGAAVPLRGFYCPGSGRIHFVRIDPATGTADQDFSAIVVNAATSPRMDGTAAVAGRGGHAAFAAQR